MTWFLDVVVYGALGLWLCFALARVQAAWEQSQSRFSQLRQALTASGLALMKDMESIDKLKAETARLKGKTATAAKEQKERHETLVRSTRPPPPEIHVGSEYPPARDDIPWIADFTCDDESGAPAEPATLLMWAPTQTAALATARRMVRAHRIFRNAAVRPLV